MFPTQTESADSRQLWAVIAGSPKSGGSSSCQTSAASRRPLDRVDELDVDRERRALDEPAQLQAEVALERLRRRDRRGRPRSCATARQKDVGAARRRREEGVVHRLRRVAEDDLFELCGTCALQAFGKLVWSVAGEKGHACSLTRLCSGDPERNSNPPGSTRPAIST